MITFLAAVPVGDAVRCIVQPPAGAVAWKVLRKPSADLTVHNDPLAGVVSEDEEYFVDTAGLTNGTAYYYRSFWQAEGGAWASDDVAPLTVTPAATAGLVGADPLNLVRERLELGLRAAVVAGDLVHELDYIPTFSAPPLYEECKFPMVTVHLPRDDVRGAGSGLGELVTTDVYLADDDEWTDTEGALARASLTIVGWVTNNADVRDALRLAIKAVLLANLPVFDAKGLREVTFDQVNVEDMESYGAPMFQVITTLTCSYTAAITSRVPAIADVSVTAQAA